MGYSSGHVLPYYHSGDTGISCPDIQRLPFGMCARRTRRRRTLLMFRKIRQEEEEEAVRIRGRRFVEVVRRAM